jgi:anhydro-N-acetylmuramic acid kinase
MSGTSLDGLDLAYCSFFEKDGRWNYQFIKTETRAYPSKLIEELRIAHRKSAEDLHYMDIELGQWMGNACLDFLAGMNPPHLIASHGHTILHQPEKGLSLQIGNPHFISAINKLPVVADFRQADVALGGQGAPLVPIGDRFLFSNYQACLNLGGFSNISVERNGIREAFDISPCNMPLNELAGRLGLAYDPNGNEAQKGQLIPELLQKLNTLNWYQQQGPKSLGREWYELEFKPIFEEYLKQTDQIHNVLNTLTSHIGMQIAREIERLLPGEGTCLVTGGGAFNAFLLTKIKDHLPYSIQLVVPDPEVVSFKEAMVFGLLGLLRFLEIPNTLASVTGAKRDACTGAIYLP